MDHSNPFGLRSLALTVAEEHPDAALTRIEAECEEAELARHERQAARLLKQLAEHIPEGEHGFVPRALEMTLAEKSGEFGLCCEETDTFSPCCGKVVSVDAPIRWLCRVCVAKMRCAYARSPETVQEGRVYDSSRWPQRRGGPRHMHIDLRAAAVDYAAWA